MKSTTLNLVARWTAIVVVVLAITPEGLAADATSSAELFAGLGPVAPDPGQSFRAAEGWHKDAVVYHVWIAPFPDSDGEGIATCGASSRVSTSSVTRA